MKKLTLFFILIFFTISYSQTKYFIYFKDKGITKLASLNKGSTLYNDAVNSLSKRSVERRKKNMGENFITYEDIPIKKEYLNELANSGVKISRELKWFNAVSAILSDEQKNKVSGLSFVDKIEPVKTLLYKRINIQTGIPSKKKSSKINNFDYGPSFEQDNLIDVPEVQSKGINGEGIVIGLLDSGFRWKIHQALSARKVIAEYDFVFNDSVTANQAEDIGEQDSHGTNVFSIIGGFKEGRIIGPAYGAAFILAKTEDERSETHIEEDNYARALIWMDSMGVDVTSSSLGYSEFDNTTSSYTYMDMDGKSTIVTKAAELAFQRGILTITAAGNEGNQKWHYIVAPADGFNTIAVGAVDNSNLVVGFSSRGPSYDGRIKPDIVAQGANVYHANPDDSAAYGAGAGTSYATPLAAGAAALLLSAYPYLTNVQARDILLKTADSYYTPDNNRGYGLVSASRAISFPNIEDANGEYKLHKIFLNNLSIIPSTVKLNILEKNSGITQLSMRYDGKLKYDSSIPILAGGENAEFYFTFSDSSGASYREPEKVNYSFKYGDLLIQMNNDASGTEIAFIDSVLDQNRPNPFTNKTKIRFNSTGNENANIIIYNILGEKVKVLFSGISNLGVNTLYWDGTTNWNTRASSGVYIYTLNLNGKFYTRKMVLVR